MRLRWRRLTLWTASPQTADVARAAVSRWRQVQATAVKALHNLVNSDDADRAKERRHAVMQAGALEALRDLVQSTPGEQLTQLGLEALATLTATLSPRSRSLFIQKSQPKGGREQGEAKPHSRPAYEWTLSASLPRRSSPLAPTGGALNDLRRRRAQAESAHGGWAYLAAKSAAEKRADGDDAVHDGRGAQPVERASDDWAGQVERRSDLARSGGPAGVTQLHLGGRAAAPTPRSDEPRGDEPRGDDASSVARDGSLLDEAEAAGEAGSGDDLNPLDMAGQLGELQLQSGERDGSSPRADGAGGSAGAGGGDAADDSADDGAGHVATTTSTTLTSPPASPTLKSCETAALATLPTTTTGWTSGSSYVGLS